MKSSSSPATKLSRLRKCDWALIAVSILILASGIQLEITGGSDALWVWWHVAIGIIFFAGIFWHLYLHFGWRSWFGRLRQPGRRATTWLATFAALTLISGLAATILWVMHPTHSHFGAIHGKIGFLMLLLAIGHTIKRRKFYCGRPKSKTTIHCRVATGRDPTFEIPTPLSAGEGAVQLP